MDFLIDPLKNSLVDYIRNNSGFPNKPEGEEGFPLFSLAVCVDCEAVYPTSNKLEKYIINCTLSYLGNESKAIITIEKIDLKVDLNLN